MIPLTPGSALFPYTTLSRSVLGVVVTYPGPGPPLTAVLQPLVAVPSVQYSLKTALLPAAGSPLQLTAQPPPRPLASSPPPALIVAVSPLVLPVRRTAQEARA